MGRLSDIDRAPPFEPLDISLGKTVREMEHNRDSTGKGLRKPLHDVPNHLRSSRRSNDGHDAVLIIFLPNLGQVRDRSPGQCCQGMPNHFDAGVELDLLKEFLHGAEFYGKGSIGVVLTGMGKDGAKGIQEIKARGGRTIAQDKETSAIFGMPKTAIETGSVEKVLPEDRIPSEIEKLLR